MPCLSSVLEAPEPRRGQRSVCPACSEGALVLDFLRQLIQSRYYLFLHFKLETVNKVRRLF